MVNKPPVVVLCDLLAACGGMPLPTRPLVPPFTYCCFYSPLSLCRLRALSGGGGGGGSGGGSGCAVASPPLSPALPKYKLAEYRYGREEMLALYVKDNKVCEAAAFQIAATAAL